MRFWVPAPAETLIIWCLSPLHTPEIQLGPRVNICFKPSVSILYVNYSLSSAPSIDYPIREMWQDGLNEKMRNCDELFQNFIFHISLLVRSAFLKKIVFQTD